MHSKLFIEKENVHCSKWVNVISLHQNDHVRLLDFIQLCTEKKICVTVQTYK